MKRLPFLTLGLLFVLALVGCVTPPVQERIVYKYIPVPVEMTQKLKLSAPPEPAFYSQLPWEKQEELLMDLIQTHTTTIGMCNARLYGIESWSVMQGKIYEEPSSASK